MYFVILMLTGAGRQCSIYDAPQLGAPGPPELEAEIFSNHNLHISSAHSISLSSFHHPNLNEIISTVKKNEKSHVHHQNIGKP